MGGGDFVHLYKNEQGGGLSGGDFVLHSNTLNRRVDKFTPRVQSDHRSGYSIQLSFR